MKRSWYFGLFLCLLTFQVSSEQTTALPDLGDPSEAVLTARQERRLGETIMHQIRQNLDILPDRAVQNYLQSLGNRLTAQNTDSQFPFYFFAVNDMSINAFALPGGFIGVNTGLILAAQDEDELASVLAHESAHVSQHHISRLYAHAEQVQLSTIAGAIASIILATQNMDAGSGALMATMANQQQSMLNFSRDNEKEADRIGIQLLHEAGFDPDAMPRFFEKLWKKTQYYGQQMPEYLQTHPLTTARIADSRARANQWPLQPSPSNLTFLLIQAKIRAENFSDRQEAATYFNHMRKKNPVGPEYIAAEYGRSVSELKWGAPKIALSFLEKLKNQLPQELLIQAAYAQSLYDAGQTSQAFRFLSRVRTRHPSDLALILQYNEWLLNQKKAKTAIQSLRQYQLRYGETPETLEMLSKAYSILPDNTQMHLTQARYLMSVGDNRGALHQLNSAKQKVSKNSKVALQIDAQTEDIKRLIEEVEGRPLKTL